VTGLPKDSGIFSYHIHEMPLAKSDSRCEETGDLFNPFNSQESCDSLESDVLCEVGDLSGKHGLIDTTSFEGFYYDPYLSLDPESPQFIGNKALNIHLVEKNDERLACANIKLSREPEDLLLLNADTEREAVKKYEDLSGVEAKYYDDDEYEDESIAAEEYDLPVEDQGLSSHQLEDRNYDDVYEEIDEMVFLEAEEEEEEEKEEITQYASDETLNFDQSSNLEKLVLEDVMKDSTVDSNQTSLFNASNISGESEEENSAEKLHYQSIIGVIVAASVALMM
jgi:hypothetical protein